jgi:aminopeptidase N
MFPCFDEPIFKTPYLLNVEHPSDMVALANTPSERVVDLG